MSDWFRLVPHGAVLTVRVTPNAGRDRIEAIATLADGAQVLKLRIPAVPEGGRANRAAIALLAKVTHIPKSAMILGSGTTARTKTILVHADPERCSAMRAAIESQITAN